jgi:hypothetical protein
MMAELYGRRTGYCKGKGGSMHIADFGIGMLGANGIVGGGISIVTGAALAAQMAGQWPRGGLLLRGRRIECWALSRMPQRRGELEVADRLRVREQSLRRADLGRLHPRAGGCRGAGGGLRHPGRCGRRQRHLCGQSRRLPCRAEGTTG